MTIRANLNHLAAKNIAILIALSALFSTTVTPAFAEVVMIRGATVESIRTDRSGRVFVNIDKSFDPRPAGCDSSEMTALMFTVNSEVQMPLFNLVSTAFITKIPLRLRFGSCDSVGSTLFPVLDYVASPD